MELERKKFQGVLNILSFNRHFYVIGISILTLLFISAKLFELSNTFFWISTSLVSYGLLMPLIVSAFVYDFSGYYDFDWLKKFNFINSNTIVNINAGFDETSFLLKDHFPESNLTVFDFYNEQEHTEKAIVRARKTTTLYPNTQQVSTNLLPLQDNSVDIVFLLSAAHEIRSQKEKIAFLTECKRICKAQGTIIMVEHLRDTPNFFAFSIGFTHFFSKKTWKKVFTQAGFCSFSEDKFTPFMSIFECRP